MSIMDKASNPYKRVYTPFDREPLARYYRIHKTLVGPRTADFLLDLSDELAPMRGKEERYAAAWARTEASLVATNRPQEDRLQWLADAEELWGTMQASDKVHITHERRARLCMATVPFFQSIITSTLNRKVIDTMYAEYLDIATDNALDIIQSKLHGTSKYYGAEKGFAHECNALLVMNRRKSPRTVAIPSTARSDSGYYHKDQAHDINVFQFRQGQLIKTTPMEVKARPRLKDFEHYKPAVIHGKIHLYSGITSSPTDTLELLYREATDRATPEHIQTLDRMTDSLTHLMSHYHNSDKLGRHCIRVAQCQYAPPWLRQPPGTTSLIDFEPNTPEFVAA